MTQLSRLKSYMGVTRAVVFAASRLSTLLALALLSFLWGGTFLYLQIDRERTIDAAIANTSNMARLFEEHVAESLKEVDQTLQFVRHAYEQDPQGFDLPAWTTNGYLQHGLTVQMSMIGPDGMLFATNVARKPAPMDLSDREHFKVHVNGTRDELFVSKPVLGRASGKWTIQLTRRVTKPDGSFGGVIVASVDSYYLSRFFEQIDLGAEGSITLLGTDGVIRARGGILASDLGRSVAGTEFFQFANSSARGSKIIDGIGVKGRRIISFRRMKDFPLIVTVAQSEAEVLAGYEQEKQIFIWTTTALSVVLLIVMWVGVVHELRLMRARNAQATSERRALSKSLELEATLRHTSQGIVMLDRNKHLRVINPRAIELLGLGATAMIGKPLPTNVTHMLSDAESKSPENSSVEISLDPDITIALSSSSLPDEGTLYTLTDISQHKRNEAVLADARDRAEAGARARASFLATMSHEIRTPLNGVIGMTQLLDDCDDVEERKTYIDTMRRSAEHLRMIIEDILDMSKLDADRMTFEFVPFDLAETVRTSIEMVEPAAAEKKLVLSSTIDPHLPSRLMGDPGRLRQVLLNLLGNAVKFTAVGSVKLEVDAIDVQDKPGLQMLRFRVTDTGIGMAPDDLGKLFKDFSQIDGSITRRFGGTGLGLAISRKLAENMGGEISVTSEIGVGSTFMVLLPICPAEESRQPAAAPAPAKTLAPAESRGLDLLLAEDSPTNTMVATRLLQKLGHRVTAVVDGVEALDALSKQSFDAIFMDVMMPRMDGLTATRLIRSSGAPYANIPIIALTAAALSEDRDEAFAAGVNCFATKPVSSDRMRASLEQALGQLPVAV